MKKSAEAENESRIFVGFFRYWRVNGLGVFAAVASGGRVIGLLLKDLGLLSPIFPIFFCLVVAIEKREWPFSLYSIKLKSI